MASVWGKSTEVSIGVASRVLLVCELEALWPYLTVERQRHPLFASIVLTVGSQRSALQPLLACLMWGRLDLVEDPCWAWPRAELAPG